MKLSILSRVLMIVAAGLLVSSIFLPIWRIELAAPQYPEGLALLIYADKLGGNVDIINGLNHYIGMQTLHTENFIEFTLLPYLVCFFALLALITGIVAKKKMLNLVFAAFVSFGIIAMLDFYRWNYNYGHNLDPHAAIVVPGMAYQPPLIGYKQLLNFGAFSIPDIGGWLFISAGLLMLIAVILEHRKTTKHSVTLKSALSAITLLILMTSCGSAGPKPVKLNKDNCDFCKMTIVDEKFVAQCATKKGRNYYFDDLACMVKYIKNKDASTFEGFYVADFNKPSSFISLNTAIILMNETVGSPMGGNMVAFSNKQDADAFMKSYNATIVIWTDLIK